MVDRNHKPKCHVSEKLRRNGRAVRREMTEAERIIWCNMRAHRFQGAGLRRQAPDGPYVVDLVCHRADLIVEVDGGQHCRPNAVLRDARRDTYLAAQGCGVVRFNHLDIMKNAGVPEPIAGVLGGAETFRLRRTPGHAGCEDVP
jgi:very-short-patch-repair endonuclease